MINKKDLDEIRQRMDEFDNVREKLIKRARGVLKLSKQIIYSLHRKDVEKAGEYMKEIDALMKELDSLVEDNTKLIYSGAFKVAVQEYVEAACYYIFIKERRIPGHIELGVGGEYYLLGLCDLTGELVRKAVNAGIDANVEEVIAIRDLVAEIYGEMLKFDFREGEIRKKFDGIKYDLKKLENLVFQLKVGR